MGSGHYLRGGGVMRLKQEARAELAEIIVEILDLAGEFDFSLVRTEEGDAYISENEINTEHFVIDLRVYAQPYAIEEGSEDIDGK
jgi:hypothetical protein